MATTGVAQGRVYTGALGIVKVPGISLPLGRLRGISWTETLVTQEVQGIGTIFTKENPVVKFQGSLTCDFYEYSFMFTGVPGASKRNASTYEQYEQNVLFRVGVEVHVYRTVEDYAQRVLSDSQNAHKALRAAAKDPDPFAIIRDVYLESESHNTSEGMISGHNQSFKYFAPVIFNSTTYPDRRFEDENPYSVTGA